MINKKTKLSIVTCNYLFKDLAKKITTIASTAILTTALHANGPFVSGTNPLSAVSYPQQASPSFGDLDGDGDLDALVGAWSGNLYYYKNNGTNKNPSFSSTTIPSGLPDSYSGFTQMAAMGDIDNDGDIDVAISRQESFDTTTSPIVYYKNNGDNTFSSFTPTGLPSVTGDKWGTLTFADVDQDGDQDLFMAHGKGGGLSYYVNDGSGIFSLGTKPIGMPSGVSYPIFTFGDVDGDGDLDMFHGAYTDTEISYYKNNAGTFQNVSLSTAFPSSSLANPGSSANPWLMPSLVDIDNDGDLDLFIGNYAKAGNNVGLVYRENSSTSISSKSPSDNSTGILLNSNLTLTFSSPVNVSSGNIHIKKTSDNTIVETISVTSSQVTGSGTTTIIINPSSDLSNNTEYYILTDSTSFVNTSTSSAVSGISNTKFWSFQTTVAPANNTPTITGATAGQAVNDNATLTPFSGITLGDADGDNISVTIALDDNAKGALSTTTIASTTIASAQTALRAITFNPTDNRGAPASTETTTFTITTNDGTDDSTPNNTTTVVSTSMNDTPTNITLSSIIVGQSGGANASVGTLGVIDVDTGDGAIFTLVAGIDDTNNSSFNIDGTDLRVNDASTLSAGTYKIRLNVNDGESNYEKAFTITLSDDITPTLTPVTIASNNATTSLAKVGDTITLSFTSSETLNVNPTVTIAGQTATIVSVSGNDYVFSRVMQSGDTEGILFTIDFSDVATNAGTQVTAVTSGSGVTFDKTAPNGHSVAITTDPINNANKSALAFQFASAETGTTYSYSIDDTNGATPAITGTGTVTSATQTISSIDVSSLDDDTLTLGVILTDPTGNAHSGVQDTVVKDVVAPVLAEVTPIATTTTDSTPEYTFSTTESGTITLGGSCGTSTSTTIGSTGNHTITLTHTDNSSVLSDTTYVNCTITLSDANGNASPTLNIPSFTVDTTTPTATFAPLTGANHPKNSNLTITFNEAVRNTDDTEITDANVASLITLKETDGSGLDVAFNATIDATKKIITINPTSDLTESQTYYLAYADVEDVVDHTRAGENITFTAEADTTAPLANTFSPTDDSLTALVDSNLSVVFNENIQKGIGNIVIKYDTNDTVVETFDINSSDRISIVNTILTIDPTNNLDFNTKYYVEIEATAIKDMASTPNTYTGISVKGDWDFTTYDKLSLSALEGANIAYTESDGNVSISSLIEVSNPSDENLTNATISISSNFISSEDKLHFTNQNGITGNFNATTGVLSLSGDANSSIYQTALRTITYENTNQSDINTTSRIVDINVTDRVATSTTLQRTIDITAVDNTPNAFSFTSLTNKAKSTLLESNTVEITGIDNNITISVSGGEYKIGDGAYTTVAGTIDNDDNVTLRQTTSSSYSTATTTSLTIGDTTANFSATTLAAPVVVTPPVPTPPVTTTPEPEEPVVEPEEPTEPEPEEPVVEPEEPVEPEPEEPVEPEPEEPVEPEVPVVPEPIEPEEPVTPEVPVTPTEPEEPVVEVEKETIIIIGDNAGEESVVINDIDTKTQIDTYEDFSDNEDGSSSASVEMVDEDGNKTTTQIKTDLSDITITSTELGVETRAEINNEDGTTTQTTSVVNTNGTLSNKVVSTDADGVETTTSVSSTKVGTNVDIATDGSLTSSYKDNHGNEVKAVASANGNIAHEIDITNESGEVIRTTATSNVKGSSAVIKEDGSVQTSARTTSQITNTEGIKEEFELLLVVESDTLGKATHMMQVKDTNGLFVITKAESEIIGATTTITQSGIQTKAKTTTTTTDAEGNTQSKELEFSAEALLNGQANHKVSFKDENGEDVITQASSEVKGATTTIKSDNTVTTQAQVTDENAQIYKAVVNTDANGQSSSWFESTNTQTDEIVREPTVNDGIFEEGNKATISEENGILKMIVETKVTKSIEF